MTPVPPSEPTAELDLGGSWQIAPSDDDLRRRYHDSDYDDTAWQRAPVPGHWQRLDAFAHHDGPMLMRRRFGTAEPSNGRRHWLVFDGIHYQSDVWLDSVYLGDTEGSFFPHAFEITPMVRARRDHCVSIEVASPRPGDTTRKRAVTGVFDASDSLDHTRNPGGIFRPVRIEESGPIRIVHHRAVCTRADAASATVALRAVLHTDTECQVTLVSRVASEEHRDVHHLAAGENRLEWTLDVVRPPLWWPWSLGEQPLVPVCIEVHDPAGEVSDARRCSMGLRQVRMHDWVTSINGERLFLKGAGHDPLGYWLGEATADDYARDLGLARDAGLDLLRVNAHIAPPALYQCADRTGMLLWQDFPLKWGYHPSVRKQAVRQAREAVDLLGHHASVVIWSAHNEPIPSQSAAGSSEAVPRGWQLALRQQAPSYNRLVIDRSVATTLRREDGSRPVITRSGMVPNLPRLDGSDTHLSLGWRVGDESQLPALAAAMPRLVRFVAEIGPQSVPVDDDFVDAARWPDLDWAHLEAAHALHRANLEHYVPTGAFDRYDEWAQATRDYQAMVIRFHVETLRRLKYRPTGGFTIANLADATPAISTGVLSAARVPKEAYTALRQACRPVVAIADRLPHHVHGGEPLALDVHVVSDRRTPIADALVEAVVEWDGGEHRQRWRGSIPADSCEHVGTVELDAPLIDGALRLVVSIDLDGERIASRYESYVFSSEHAH